MSAFGTNTFMETGYVNASNFTALANNSAEASLIAGVNEQPVIPPNFFNVPTGLRRRLIIEAGGVIGSTGTPTIVIKVLLSQSSGSTIVSGAANTTTVSMTPTITMQSGVTNKWWYLRVNLTVTTPGFGSTSTCTLTGSGYAMSSGWKSTGAVSDPSFHAMTPDGTSTATWTSTINGAVQHYVHLTGDWSAADPADTIQILAGQLCIRGES